MAENENKNSSQIPDKISSISDDEAINEIDFNSFLEGQDSAALFDEFHADIEKTEKDLNDELASLYENIMSQEPDTIVPKPMDAILGDSKDIKEETGTPLDDMWMSPEEYIEMDIPVVDLEDSKAPELENSPESESAKGDLFSMIDKLKEDTDNESGFSKILSEIEGNSNIEPVSTELDEASKLVEGPIQDEADRELSDKLDKYLADENEKARNKNAENDNLTAGPEESNFDFNVEKLPEIKPVVGNAPIILSKDDNEPDDDEKPKKKKKAEKADDEDDDPQKKSGASEIIRKTVLVISIITIVISSGVLIEQYIYEPWKFKKQQSEIQNLVAVETPGVSSDVVDADDSKYPKGMLKKYTQLYDQNEDLSGWISIPALEINLPIAKGSNNDYYLHRNIYKQWTMYGVPFFDYRMTNLKTLHRNTVVYGHNMRHDDLIFGLLENYREISGFENAPVIECNTIYGDHTWFVYAVFITNSYAKDDNGYVFPYNFIDCGDTKFASYIEEIDKRKLYTTGVDINETDKILTLSTCCYDFDEARLVVVAREMRENETATVDTSRASLNTNPKYPQAWYTANKKTNPYADDAQWK